MYKLSIIFHENSKQIDLSHFLLCLKNASKLMKLSTSAKPVCQSGRPG